jgi:ribosomal protein S12 methylthiotransferase accessory factor
MEMTISFPGGKRVNASFMGRTIPTDQAREAGGDGSAPEPYTLFLSSIGTCAGIYVLGFCQARGIPTDGIQLTQKMEFDPTTHRLSQVRIEIEVPPSFPEKYLGAVRRAADLCAVKRAILEPPEFVVETKVVADGDRPATTEPRAAATA